MCTSQDDPPSSRASRLKCHSTSWNNINASTIVEKWDLVVDSCTQSHSLTKEALKKWLERQALKFV